MAAGHKVLKQVFPHRERCLYLLETVNALQTDNHGLCLECHGTYVGIIQACDDHCAVNC
jgi:hypothetical protein